MLFRDLDLILREKASPKTSVRRKMEINILTRFISILYPGPLSELSEAERETEAGVEVIERYQLMSARTMVRMERARLS